MMMSLRSLQPTGNSLQPFVAGLCLLAGSVACDVNVRDGKASFGVFSAEATDDWTHYHALDAGGRVEIINLNGPVELSAGPAGTVEVHATITAKAMTDAGARDILARGKVQEAADQSRVHLETLVPRGVHGSYEVRYQVRMPADAQADISTTNGSLKADGLAGKMKVTVVNGKVDLDNMSGAIDGVVANGSMTVTVARMTAAIRLDITNGRLAVELPATSHANLSARVVNGSISVTGLSLDQPVGRRIQSLEAPLNGGGPEMNLRTTNGRISIDGK